MNLQWSAPLMLVMAFGLAACGGGGGGGGGGGSAPATNPCGGSTTRLSAVAQPLAGTYTLSGTISLPETSAVDSDTSDPLQPGWTRNDTLATAQTLTTPTQLIGSVNVDCQGDTDAAAYVSGDEYDVYLSNLSAGQVVELSFSESASSHDLDLGIVDASTGSIVGISQGVSNNECIKLSRTGSYYLIVFAYKGASLYNLRIGAPGEGGSCGIVSTSGSAAFVHGELVTLDASGSGVPARVGVPATHAMRTLGLRGRQYEAWPGAAESSNPVLQRAERALDTLFYARALRKTGSYDFVEPNYVMTQLYLPGDPSYTPQRWHYDQINQPSAIDRLVAASPMSQRPIVAVIDSGLVIDHPEFTGQQVAGYSFINGSATAGGNDPSAKADSPAWHGTHVAGTIAAADNNAVFGASVAPYALIMPLRVFQPSVAYTTSYDVTQAILYAAGLANVSGSVPARKADVINMSLGGSGTCPTSYSNAITQARAQNVIVVAAAGNSARNDLGNAVAVGTPANCDGVIAVGALDANKQQTYYSQSGTRLALMAPGGDGRVSTTGTGYPDNVYSTLGAFNSGGARVASFGGMSGTSMAAPHVAGVMALMRYANPAITPAQIDTRIALGLLSDDLGAVGRDDATGYGLINARKAVDEALALASGSSTAPSGIIVASPAGIDFGSLTTNASLKLKLTAASSETVVSLTPSISAVSVSPVSIDAGTRLGDYLVTVDRSTLPVGTSYPVITVQTSTRSFTVQLAVTKLSAVAGSTAASFGRLWIVARSASTGAVIKTISVSPSGGKYSWSMTGIPAGDVTLLAGTDNNFNGFFCDPGEACGQHPSVGSFISVNGDTSGVDFAVALTSTTSSSGLLPPQSLR